MPWPRPNKALFRRFHEDAWNSVGPAPTGRPVRLRGIAVVRVAGGRVSEFWKRDNSRIVPQQPASTGN